MHTIVLGHYDAVALVDSINYELGENATVITISAAINATFVCRMIAAVVTSFHMLCLKHHLICLFQKNLSSHQKRLDTLPCQTWYAFSLDIEHTPTFNYMSKAVDTIYDTDISDTQVFIDMIHEWDQDGFVYESVCRSA